MQRKEKVRALQSSSNGRSLQRKAKAKKTFGNGNCLYNGRRFSVTKTYFLNVAYNGRSYTQAGTSTTELPAKSRISIYYFSFYKMPKPDLRVACCCRAAFFVHPGIELSIQGYCWPELLFLRLINCPVAWWRAKKKFAHCNLRQMADLLRAKPRQRKPSGTEDVYTTADASA